MCLHTHIHDVAFIYSSEVVHLGCFPALTIVNNVTINMGEKITLLYSSFNSLSIHPEVGLLDHMVVLL
jgi:hypothetical protein